MGKILSIASRRRGPDTATNRAELVAGLEQIVDAVAGDRTAFGAEQVEVIADAMHRWAYKLRGWARRARRIERGPCQACGTDGCDLWCPGAVWRDPGGRRWLLLYRTQTAMRVQDIVTGERRYRTSHASWIFERLQLEVEPFQPARPGRPSLALVAGD